jgi:hypothetical protein
MREYEGLQRSVYGKLCLVLNAVLDLGESPDKPYIVNPVEVNVSWPSRKAHACVVQPGVLALGYVKITEGW